MHRNSRVCFPAWSHYHNQWIHFPEPEPPNYHTVAYVQPYFMRVLFHLTHSTKPPPKSNKSALSFCVSQWNRDSKARNPNWFVTFWIIDLPIISPWGVTQEPISPRQGVLLFGIGEISDIISQLGKQFGIAGVGLVGEGLKFEDFWMIVWTCRNLINWI